ncbi:aminopeptidase P family protein [Alicyclobacillus ferrooxydans]|uniref:Xaa-Pro aminopeptidase n=1 Tax=Alicyclobacillus ferrooxydans TaxID=471514 RepID=A0A0N8PNY8_9BACL|nr:aminopeptidase P family protein [Alicyclobacillus ferrooxydans]KPV42845.1 hypothetical protein AN477_15505 [Alicyclobacillus ferrooxydans]
MSAEFYAANRKRLADSMKDFSVLVLFAGRAPHRSADSEYPFTPNRNFYYLTGIDRENVILRIVKRDGDVEETLYVERPDEVAAKWTGERLSANSARELSGAQSIAYLDEFDAQFKALFRRTMFKQLYLSFESEAWDTPSTPAHEFADQVRTRMPHLKIKNAFPLICELRAVKSEEEVAQIRRAIEITNDGIHSMLKNVHPGMMEYQLQAYFDFELTSAGVHDHAFPSIIAGGQRATVLHYVENNQELKDGELVLIDLGAAWNYYSADISRTFPVNGKFTDRQREIYEIVLTAEEETIAAVKPGMTLKELNDVTKKVLARELKRIGKIKEDDEVVNYYYHSVSHSMGLDTHDVWDSSYKIVPGAVITIEPGLYLADEGIGIRIEDDVIVTKHGCEVLSPEIPKTVEDIERLIQGR